MSTYIHMYCISYQKLLKAQKSRINSVIQRMSNVRIGKVDSVHRGKGRLDCTASATGDGTCLALTLTESGATS